MPRVKNPHLKRPGQQHEYDFDQIKELKRCMTDPIYFIETYVKIQHPTLGIIPFALRSYQKKMILAYQSKRFTIVLSARQTGKALSVNTDIPTPTGFVKMLDIKPGDLVLGADGKPTKVTAVSPIQHNRLCYNVYFSTGECITADAEHLWEVEYVENVKNKTLVLTTQQIIDKGILRPNNRGYAEGKFNVKVTQPLDLPEQSLPVDPYVLGAWLGDDTSSQSAITNHSHDSTIIERVSLHHNVSNVQKSAESPETKTFYFQNLRTQLRELNILNNKHIPIIYLRCSYSQRLALLQGLMDTDGYINPKTGLCEITLTNEVLIKDISELISTLGLKSTIKQREIKGKTPHTRWTITFTPYLSQCQPFSLKRKAQYVKNLPHKLRKRSTQKRTIVKIEQTSSVPVKCIVVENPDHLFLVGRSMIPTHNSETAGAYLLWYACFHDAKNILIASNKNSNAMEMVHRIRLGYENLPHWLKPGVTEDGWNKHNIGFDNGTRIISEATSEKSGRGLAISLLYLDEFAHVAQNIQEEFWTSIEPTLSTGGSCIMTSTPNGDSDIFAQTWNGAMVESNGFFPVEVKWDEAPGRDGKFREETIGRIGEVKWRQEYECDFLSSDALLINSIKLAEITQILRGQNPHQILYDVVFWREIKTGGTYLVGVDPATGTGKDFTVITVYEFPMMRQVAEYRSNTMSPNQSYKTLKNLLLYLEGKGTTVYFSVENNGVGEGIISLFEADESAPLNSEFVSEPGKDKRGFYTTSRTKMKACVNFKEMFEKGNLIINSPILLNELKKFVRKRTSYDHSPGSTSDCISATLVVIRIVEEIATYDQNAFDKLYSTTDFTPWEIQENYDENDVDSAPLPMA